MTEEEQVEFVGMKLAEFLRDLVLANPDLTPRAVGIMLLGASAGRAVVEGDTAQTFCELAYDAYQHAYVSAIELGYIPATLPPRGSS